MGKVAIVGQMRSTGLSCRPCRRSAVVRPVDAQLDDGTEPAHCARPRAQVPAVGDGEEAAGLGHAQVLESPRSRRLVSCVRMRSRSSGLTGGPPAATTADCSGREIRTRDVRGRERPWWAPQTRPAPFAFDELHHLTGVEPALRQHDSAAGQETRDQARQAADQPAVARQDVLLVAITERSDSSTAFGSPELPEVNRTIATSDVNVFIGVRHGTGRRIEGERQFGERAGRAIGCRVRYR